MLFRSRRRVVRPVSFPHPWPALEKAAELWPDAVALVFPHQNERRSFLQWRNDALALTGQLAAHGLRRGDHVALLAENRVEWPIVQMACASLGALFIPLNTHYRRDDLAFALKQSRARAIFSTRSSSATAPWPSRGSTRMAWRASGVTTRSLTRALSSTRRTS